MQIHMGNFLSYFAKISQLLYFQQKQKENWANLNKMTLQIIQCTCKMCKDIFSCEITTVMGDIDS